MFAMTSGTTGQPKRLPITAELFRGIQSRLADVGAGRLATIPTLLAKHTVQLASDWQQYRAPSGVPCGQISGLAAMTRPRMTQITSFPCRRRLGQIHDPAARHYASLRFASHRAASAC